MIQVYNSSRALYCSGTSITRGGSVDKGARVGAGVDPFGQDTFAFVDRSHVSGDNLLGIRVGSLSIVRGRPNEHDTETSDFEPKPKNAWASEAA